MARIYKRMKRSSSQGRSRWRRFLGIASIVSGGVLASAFTFILFKSSSVEFIFSGPHDSWDSLLLTGQNMNLTIESNEPGFVLAAAGEGPRSFVFHPSGTILVIPRAKLFSNGLLRQAEVSSIVLDRERPLKEDSRGVRVWRPEDEIENLRGKLEDAGIQLLAISREGPFRLLAEGQVHLFTMDGNIRLDTPYDSLSAAPADVMIAAPSALEGDSAWISSAGIVLVGGDFRGTPLAMWLGVHSSIPVVIAARQELAFAASETFPLHLMFNHHSPGLFTRQWSTVSVAPSQQAELRFGRSQVVNFQGEIFDAAASPVYDRVARVHTGAYLSSTEEEGFKIAGRAHDLRKADQSLIVPSWKQLEATLILGLYGCVVALLGFGFRMLLPTELRQ